MSMRGVGTAWAGVIPALVLGLWASVVAAPAAGAFVLVTPEEFARDRSAEGRAQFRGSDGGDMGSPAIVLVTPARLSDVLAPVNIELRFVPKSPSAVVLDSLRVLYGFFGINVTDRLLKHATVTPTGISAKGASLPEGSHDITIEIADSRNRVARKTFHFEVKEAKE